MGVVAAVVACTYHVTCKEVISCRRVEGETKREKGKWRNVEMGQGV